MDLEKLLKTDKEAARLFSHLAAPAQEIIRRRSKEIDSLAALREYTAHIVSNEGPFYPQNGVDGTQLDPELKARWTMEHQA